MKKPKRKSIFDLPKKTCAYVKCRKRFKPNWTFQKYHSNDCKVADNNLKKAILLREAKEHRERNAAQGAA